MFLADTLSRAYLLEVNVCDHDHEPEAIDHKDNLAVSAERCQQISHASADDPVLQQLRATIRRGWPETNFGVLVPLLRLPGHPNCPGRVSV